MSPHGKWRSHLSIVFVVLLVFVAFALAQKLHVTSVIIASQKAEDTDVILRQTIFSDSDVYVRSGSSAKFITRVRSFDHDDRIMAVVWDAVSRVYHITITRSHGERVETLSAP